MALSRPAKSFKFSIEWALEQCNSEFTTPLIISSFNKLTRAHHVTERDNLTTDDFLTGKVVDFVAGVVCLFLTDCLVPGRLRLRRNKRND